MLSDKELDVILDTAKASDNPVVKEKLEDLIVAVKLAEGEAFAQRMQKPSMDEILAKLKARASHSPYQTRKIWK